MFRAGPFDKKSFALIGESIIVPIFLLADNEF